MAAKGKPKTEEERAAAAAIQKLRAQGKSITSQGGSRTARQKENDEAQSKGKASGASTAETIQKFLGKGKSKSTAAKKSKVVDDTTPT